MALCTSCKTNRATGKIGKESLPGRMSQICLDCAKAEVLAGRCPMCSNALDDTHVCVFPKKLSKEEERAAKAARIEERAAARRKAEISA